MSPILNSLSKSVERPRRTGVLALRYQLPERSERHWVVDVRPVRRGRRKPARDERFKDYLSSSFTADARRPAQRHEERNRALVLAVFAGLVLFGILYRLLMG